jgi:hypothetical protein
MYCNCLKILDERQSVLLAEKVRNKGRKVDLDKTELKLYEVTMIKSKIYEADRVKRSV